MYFKRLEIFGFKSFADKTVLNFEPGTTAIVGPNGCGKSNIFDSIRWVLGEQSVKDLRGSSMEDVIFNGTEKKPSLGFAEVSLVLSNECGSLPMDREEITITRRLFRSGESEYLLNKSVARLKDIQELLMGTGIGAEAYSLIQQGKVDQVVSARPEDRRLIIDEASGITKYRAKKREAMNKLKSTEENLLRLNDITIEVKRQIASIERQANKARKYKAEYENLKNLEVKFACYQMNNFGDEKERLNDQLSELKAKETNLEADLEELNKGLTDQINFLSELDEEISVLRAEEIKLDGQVDLNEKQISFDYERIENIVDSDKKLNDQKEQLIERCRLQQDKIEELKKELTASEEKTCNNEETVKQRREELILIERSIVQSKDKIKDEETKILDLTSTQVSIRNELTDIMKDIQGNIARKRRLEIENEKVSYEKQEVDQKLQNVEYQITTLTEAIRSLKVVEEEKSVVLNRLDSDSEQLQNRINDLEKRKLFLISQKEFIEKLHTQYQDIPDPVVEGRLITQSPPLDHHTGILGKVKEVQSIDLDKSPHLKNLLSQKEVNTLYEITCETKFIELDPQQISKKIDEIGAEVNQLNGEKEVLLARIKEQRSQLEELQGEIFNKEKSCSILEAQKKGVLEEKTKIMEELELVDGELEEVHESLASTKKKEEELNYKLDTVNQDIAWAQNDIRDIQNSIAAKSEEREKVTIAIAQVETEMELNKEQLKSQQENYRMFTETIDSWLEEMKRVEDDIESQKGKQGQYVEEIELLKKQNEEIVIQKQSVQESLSSQEAEKVELGHKINGARNQINRIEEDIVALKQDRHQREMNGQELGFNEKGIKDRLMQSYKIDFDEVLAAQARAVADREAAANDIDSKEDLESSSQEVFSDSSELAEKDSVSDGVANTSNDGDMKKEQEVEVDAPVFIFDPEEDIDADELVAEIERLRKRCDSFGSVNLVAIEEYEELKERFEFLTKQQSDLFEAKSQLMSTINKINRTTRQMFMDTFTKVSEEFRIYFRMLFGGGEAQLQLIDPNNVLESGIDIVARPPGKKLQNISLLSGGEKTLTAIALIFGVFKVNPSPFCILDEIDAALDESNVGRFSYLLKDFAQIAQFIVITHNKKTISSADVMYGITMPETGCSRIVSVKLSEKDKQEEKVPAGV